MTEFVIKISSSLKYGHCKGWKASAERLAKLIKDHVDVINSMLDLPERVNINIRPLKGRTHGLWYDTSKSLSIDPRVTNMDKLMGTLFHELVHAEQYKQGRLKRMLDQEERAYCDYWNGVKYKRPSSTYTKKGYAKYRALPWEEEAFEREKLLTLQFIREMIR